MLVERKYIPSKGDIIYHYCSAETFNLICTNKKLRFTDIFSMNDFMELQWGYHQWIKVANEYVDTLKYDFIDKIDSIIHESSLHCLPLAVCFSESGDVLSQWRAYADDGEGYAIGFDANLLIQLSINPLKISYDEDEQKDEIIKFIDKSYELEGKEDEKNEVNLTSTCMEFAFDLCAFKNPSFSEEKEIRLTHLLNFEESNNSSRLVDNGGTAFGREHFGDKISFFMRKSAPVTFIDMDYTDKNLINPIREVILGPKNHTLETAISIYLETLGIPSVDVSRSRASYR
ncbi:DUF2971 domain-containing protein [Rahnella bonaserana]|uniref:DUF2971 domain-containing protein n=1 Tax=Rahnella bonaserana TaxID=2816248 RepID=UPI0024C2670A|nr:DUF2971 domain-containing protein [Rahnella bonaserana]WHZ41838.1 DUF2971 domain-containing protein [Rahnella bonaserana]